LGRLGDFGQRSGFLLFLVAEQGVLVLEGVRASHGDEAVALDAVGRLAETRTPAPGGRVGEGVPSLLLEGQLLAFLPERVRLADGLLLLLLRIEVDCCNWLVLAVDVFIRCFPAN